MARYLKYEVSDIYVYPFGFSAIIHHLNHAKSNHILLIMISGLGLHILFIFLIQGLYLLDIISISYCDYLLKINLSIFMFNLIPIYPLDGSRCLFAILRYFFSYRLCKIIIYIISFVFIIIFMNNTVFSFKIVLMMLFILCLMDMRRYSIDLVEYSYYKEKYFNVEKNNV